MADSFTQSVSGARAALLAIALRGTLRPAVLWSQRGRSLDSAWGGGGTAGRRAESFEQRVGGTVGMRIAALGLVRSGAPEAAAPAFAKIRCAPCESCAEASLRSGCFCSARLLRFRLGRRPQRQPASAHAPPSASQRGSRGHATFGLSCGGQCAGGLASDRCGASAGIEMPGRCCPGGSAHVSHDCSLACPCLSNIPQVFCRRSSCAHDRRMPTEQPEAWPCRMRSLTSAG